MIIALDAITKGLREASGALAPMLLALLVAEVFALVLFFLGKGRASDKTA